MWVGQEQTLSFARTKAIERAWEEEELCSIVKNKHQMKEEATRVRCQSKNHKLKPARCLLMS